MPRNEKGQVLVLFLAALVVLLGFAALGVDVGYVYTVRHELQRSTDAGALAGASAFLDGDWAAPSVRAAADRRARRFASMDTVASSPLNPGQEVTIGFPARERISVDASRTVDLFFSRIFLGPTKRITARSVAESSSAGRNVRGLKPWGIPFPWEDANGNGLYDPGETVHRDCPEGIADTSSYFCPGTRVILKIGTPANNPKNPSGIPSTQQEAGHFFALDFASSGAAGYSENIRVDTPLAFSIGDTIPLETGNMVGPTIQGTDSLVGADPNSAWNAAGNLPESDLYPIEGGAWMSSPRVIRIPVYDPEETLKTGKTGLVVAAIAGFWIEGTGTQGTVIGRFIPNRAFGNLGPGDGPTSGPVVKVLHLVE